MYGGLRQITTLQIRETTGVIEVHVVFDAPGLQAESPKEIEQLRRDQKNNTSTSHHCIDFCSDLLVLEKWRTILGCRTCKKSLTAYVADDMLRLICSDHFFRSHQTFITNIGGQTYATNGQTRQLRTDLCTNADEADLRVWLHCQMSCGVNKLLYFIRHRFRGGVEGPAGTANAVPLFTVVRIAVPLFKAGRTGAANVPPRMRDCSARAYSTYAWASTVKLILTKAIV